jgi:hypothetical protein
MMTNIQNTTKKVLAPTALAIAMLFMTPVVGLLSAGFKTPAAVHMTSNETVVYKKSQSSVAFKS